MMNKRIRSMVDEIFSQMQMTAENLALRDELLANAQARYEDVVGGGKSEEEAFAEVAVSLEDVHELLREMNGGAAQESAQAEPAPKAQEEPADEPTEEPVEEEPKAEQPQANDKADIDLGETLNKAFSALGSFGKSIMPQAKKLVREVDNATGGALKSVGKAVNKTMKDAQKVAGDAIDKMSDKGGELVFDFGKREEPKAQEESDPDILRSDARTLREEALELREEAADLRAEAGFKKVTGDQAGADELNAKADALEAQAGGLDAQADGLNVQADMLEQAQAMEDAAKAAAEEAAAQAEEPVADEPIILEEKHAPLMDMDGDVNEDVFTRVVEQIELETERVLGDEPAQEDAQDAEYTVKDEAASERKLLFPAAGLRTVDIELDADDVRIECCEGSLIETVWSAQCVEGEPEIVMEGHKLKIRRKNPDVFKTFFSAFSKNGGKITVRVPHGYAADYKINTTSGDIVLDEVDMESAKVNTASGIIRLEPDAAVRVQQIKANTVSGNVNVSACAEDVKVNTVSGDLFISCDAQKVSAASVSGRIYAEGACDIWDVDSVSGSVELVCTAVPGKKIQVDTVSASASVALPGSIRGFVAEMSGVSGKLVNEFGPDRYGTCALPIRMNSMSGSMKITKL